LRINSLNLERHTLKFHIKNSFINTVVHAAAGASTAAGTSASAAGASASSGASGSLCYKNMKYFLIDFYTTNSRIIYLGLYKKEITLYRLFFTTPSTKSKIYDSK
jgi:hypothetical protein